MNLLILISHVTYLRLRDFRMRRKSITAVENSMMYESIRVPIHTTMRLITLSKPRSYRVCHNHFPLVWSSAGDFAAIPLFHPLTVRLWWQTIVFSLNQYIALVLYLTRKTESLFQFMTSEMRYVSYGMNHCDPTHLPIWWVETLVRHTPEKMVVWCLCFVEVMLLNWFRKIKYRVFSRLSNSKSLNREEKNSDSCSRTWICSI